VGVAQIIVHSFWEVTILEKLVCVRLINFHLLVLTYGLLDASHLLLGLRLSSNVLRLASPMRVQVRGTAVQIWIFRLGNVDEVVRELLDGLWLVLDYLVAVVDR
jgi:hypothetical protein